MSQSSRIFLLLATLVLVAGTLQTTELYAKDKGKGKPDKVQQAGDFDIDVTIEGMVRAGISVGDARQLASRHQLTGAKPLPPGIRKNLARGKPLPPGIAKQTMPGGFLGDLPHHQGFEWRQAGADLVLVASGSLVISDVLEGVFD